MQVIIPQKPNDTSVWIEIYAAKELRLTFQTLQFET